VDGPYDFTKFGLFDSRVGPDTLHDSMFENIGGDTMQALNPPYVPVITSRSALLAAFIAAQSKVESDYTPGSWQAAGLPGAIAQALAVYHDATAAQAQVDAQTSALNGALAMLVRKPDLKTLDAALRKAKARVEKNYTADSWAAADLPDAIASAAAVRADPNAAQAQVDEQTAALLEAMAKLVRK
jgi:hypothetical protein